MWTVAVNRASRAWQDQCEALNGPRKNLTQAESSLLGDRVGPAAEAFLTTWEEQVRVLRDRAEGHADALAEAMYDFHLTDGRSVKQTQSLLLWEDRTTMPAPGVGP